MAQGTQNTDEKTPLSVKPTTDSGRPARVDGAIAVEIVTGDGSYERTSDTSGFLVTPSAGAHEFRVTADADLGAGVETIEEMVIITASDPRAKNLGVSLGTPVPRE